MNDLVEILGCDGTALYENDNHSLKFTTSGRLEVLIAYDGLIMLKLNNFQYGVKPSDQIVCSKNDPQFKMVLYLRKYPTGKWILKISEHTDEVYSCLNEKCYIVEKNQSRNQYSSQNVQNIYSKTDPGQEKSTKKSKKSKKQKEQKCQSKSEKLEEQQGDLQVVSDKITAGKVLVGASKGLGFGLKLTGKLLSKGFEAVGSLASKVVKPVEKVQVSENAKANIDLAKKTSKTVFSFAATQVGNLFQFGKNVASNVGERFQKSQKGKEMQEDARYSKVKQGTKTGVQVFSNIYEGVVEAVYEVGSGISKGTSKVVGKKYGDEAGQAAEDVFEGVGNVIKISRIPQDEAAKAFK